MSDNEQCAVIFSHSVLPVQQPFGYSKTHLQEACLPSVNPKDPTLQKLPKQDCAEMLYSTGFKKLFHEQKAREVLSIKILLYLSALVYCVLNKVYINTF